MNISKDHSFYVSIEDVINNISEIEASELLRPLIKKLIKEYTYLTNIHREYYLKWKDDPERPDLAKYQKDCVSTIPMARKILVHMLGDLDKLNKAVNAYNKVRGGKGDQKI